MTKVNYKTIALTLGLIAFSFLFAWYILAWDEPTAVPPGGNVQSPLNVGPIAQAKEGMLWLAYNPAVTTGLIVEYGNVGIGTTSPGAALDIQNLNTTTNRSIGLNVNSNPVGQNRVYGTYSAAASGADKNYGSYGTAYGGLLESVGFFGSASNSVGGIAYGAMVIGVTAGSGDAYGVHGTAINVVSTSNANIYGVYGVADNLLGAAQNAYGLYGIARNAVNNYGLYIAEGKAYLAGNVGIGTTSPGAKLDVNGDIISNGLGVVLNSSATNMRMVVGQVRSDGVIIAGTGFTAVRTAVASYLITLIPAYTAQMTPVIGAASYGYAWAEGIDRTAPTYSSFFVRTVDAGGSYVNRDFTFVVFGPK